MNTLRAAVDFAKGEHNGTLVKTQGKRQNEFESWKATTLWSGATLAKLLEVTSVLMYKLLTGRGSAVALHRKMFASIHRIVKDPKEKKDNEANTPAKLLKVNDDGRFETVKAHVTELRNL